MYVKHKANAPLPEGSIKTAPQWFLSLFHFPQDFSLFFCCSIIYISSMIFSLPYLLQKGRNKQTTPTMHKNKWERRIETDTLITWPKVFRNFYLQKFSSKRYSFMDFPHEIILLYELFYAIPPSMEMVSVCQRPIIPILDKAFSSFLN